MKSRVKAFVAAQKTPLKWLVLDASAINIVDATGLRKFDGLREELAAVGVSVYVARLKRHLGHFFNEDFVKTRRERGNKHLFQTLRRRKKAQKSLMQALQPTIDDYLKHQHAASEPEKDSVAGEQDLSVHKRRLQALKPAIDAFLKQQQEAGRIANDENVADQAWMSSNGGSC